MDLKENLLLDMKEALKARNSLKLNTIRGLISEIKNREIDLRRKLDSDEIISLVSTQIKKRKEAATMFDEGGRSDLSEKENQEMAILQESLLTNPLYQTIHLMQLHQLVKQYLHYLI